MLDTLTKPIKYNFSIWLEEGKKRGRGGLEGGVWGREEWREGGRRDREREKGRAEGRERKWGNSF